MTPEIAKSFVEMLALIAAAGFFTYTIIAGYFCVALALSVVSERERLNEQRDVIVVTVALKKSGSGMIRLHDAQVQFIPVEGSSAAVPLIGFAAEARSPRQSVLDVTDIKESIGTSSTDLGLGFNSLLAMRPSSHAITLSQAQLCVLSKSLF